MSAPNFRRRETIGLAALFGLLDFAARVCPVKVAASVFALLMAVSNTGLSLSYLVGGYLYELVELGWNRPVSFRVVVALGAFTTACCWLFVPPLTRAKVLQEGAGSA